MTIEILARSEIYWSGYMAAQKGEASDTCPFADDVSARELWLAGHARRCEDEAAPKDRMMDLLPRLDFVGLDDRHELT